MQALKPKAENRPILFFDGVCNLCNETVQFILRHERNDQLRFSPLQSRLGQEITAKLPAETDSLVLLETGNIYIRSTAALKVSKYLRFPYHLLRHLQFIPLFIREPVYRFIARHRYRIFGKKESCMIPTPDILHRFL